MNYLFIDLDLAIKRVNYLEGKVLNCEYYCKCLDTLLNYKNKNNKLRKDYDYKYNQDYYKAYKKLCNNFKAFMKRHNYFKTIK